MKTSLLTMCALLLATFFLKAQSPLTDSEREYAIKHLVQSKMKIEKTIDGLSEAQLNYKSSEDSWSIADCIEHLAISETGLFGIVEASLQNQPDPSLRSEVKMSDDQIIGFIEDRSTKVKTQAPFEPSDKFGSFEGSLKAFNDKRGANIDYLRTTADDLRNRYYDFPFGKVDSYQVLLFISGHSVRHLKQIEEVMANEAFPGS